MEAIHTQAEQAFQAIDRKSSNSSSVIVDTYRNCKTHANYAHRRQTIKKYSNKNKKLIQGTGHQTNYIRSINNIN